jgi:hypothetical protein
MTDVREGAGVAVSLPAEEIRGIRFSGSVFDHRDLEGARLSDELRQAIFLIERTSAEFGSVVKYVARPEIFTHGVSLAWLRQTLGSIRDHVSVSDGSALRVIPGMRNHAFFYAQGRRGDAEALSRLEQRAPELFSTLTTQINTAYRFGIPTKLHFPTPVALQARAEREPPATTFFRFYLKPSSIEDSVAAALDSESRDIPGVPTEPLTYIPLTEAGARDPAFANALASLLARTFFDSSQRVILRLPMSADPGDALSDRLGSVLTALVNAKILIPAAPASNICFSTEDVPLDRLRAGSRTMNFVAHDSFDFWRYPHDFYAAFETMRVCARRGRHNPTALTNLLIALCGRKPELIWPLSKDRRRTT